MADYALLLMPAANRVYAAATTDLARAELAVLGNGDVDGIRTETIAGVPYVRFAAEHLDTARVASHSAAYALFALGHDGALLPLELPQLARFDDDLLTILKYAGKTNEQFTRLLLNVTVAALPSTPGGRPVRVLDPVCGRGTTLNQALVNGWDATGIDLDRKDFDAYATFLRTWLERKRLKHRCEVSTLRRDKRVLARQLVAETAPTPEEWQAGHTRRIRMLCADTRETGELLRGDRYDVVVGDLPYGVQHGSRSADRALSRGPLGLLEDALPGWLSVLRPGGAVGLSWNTKVAPRPAVVRVLADAGLTVRDEPPWDGFAHRVDQSIHRDLVVAVRD
jgi:SAM-dependent methyltransferase